MVIPRTFLLFLSALLVQTQLVNGDGLSSRCAATLSNELHISGITCRDVRFSRTNNLFYLDLQFSPIHDLSQLANVLWRHNLHNYTLFGRDVPNLELNLCHTQITNATPLWGLPVTMLWIYGTPLRDLSSLAGIPVQDLMLDRAISDVSAICHLPLRTLYFSPFSATNGMNRLRRLDTLKTINGQPAEEFWKYYDITYPKRKSSYEQVGDDERH